MMVPPASVPITAIVAPPPTANGDLHLGHLSGPYLGADVCRRYLALRRREVISALSLDVNQSYVVTTAERLGVSPADLVHRSHREVSETLNSAQIRFDAVGLPDEAYSAYVSDWFRALHKSGAFYRREYEAVFDIKTGRALFEAYASGRCPHCLATTKANICEGCGNPNDATDLLNLYPTGGTPQEQVRRGSASAWMLDLECYRDEMVEVLGRLSPQPRPTLRRLLDEIFSRRLPQFPITFPSSWGIPAPFDDASGEVLNVWAEMVPGHYWWLRQAARNAAARNGFDLSKSKYIQYLGFDNSFFYAIAHLGLALAARRAGVDSLLPAALITNEFLLLESYKFSTSKGHLIWGRDLLSSHPADEVRFYLAWINPELQQSTFSVTDFESVVAMEFRARVEALCALLPQVSHSGAVSEHDATRAASALQARFEAALEPSTQSLRLLALAVATGLEVALERSRRGEPLGSLVRVLAAGSAPLVPTTALRLWRLVEKVGPLEWPNSRVPSSFVGVDRTMFA